jgi:hypothetical protein
MRMNYRTMVNTILLFLKNSFKDKYGRLRPRWGSLSIQCHSFFALVGRSPRTAADALVGLFAV